MPGFSVVCVSGRQVWIHVGWSRRGTWAALGAARKLIWMGSLCFMCIQNNGTGPNCSGKIHSCRRAAKYYTMRLFLDKITVCTYTIIALVYLFFLSIIFSGTHHLSPRVFLHCTLFGSDKPFLFLNSTAEKKHSLFLCSNIVIKL